MKMHNPPHPGEFIREIYLEPYNLSIRQVAEKLSVTVKVVLLKGRAISVLRWLYAFPKRWEELRKAGSSYKINSIYGKHSKKLTSIKSKNSYSFKLQC